MDLWREYIRRMMNDWEKIYFRDLGLRDWKQRAKRRMQGVHARRIVKIIEREVRI